MGKHRKSNSVGRGGPISRCWLAPCTQKLMAVVSDPIGERPGACACMGVCQPSQKVKGYVRGTFTAGTAGFGWIAVNPYVAMTNNVNCLWTTGAGYAGTSVNAAAAGVTGASLTTNPYPAASLTGDPATASVRLVAAGLRIESIDAPLNRKGRQLAFTDPDHNTVDGRAFQGLSVRPGVQIGNSSEPAVSQCRWAQADMDEYDFEAYNAISSMCMVAMVDGAASGQLFEFALALHFEVVGTLAQNLVTPSSMDPVGGPVFNDLIMGTPALLQAPELPIAVLQTAVQNKIAHQVSLPPPQARPAALKAAEHASHLADASVRFGTNSASFKGGISPELLSWAGSKALEHLPGVIEVLAGLF